MEMDPVPLVPMDSRVLARVTKEVELVQNSPVLILNNFCLTSIPNPVLSNQHCQLHLKELCLKNNRITSLVSDPITALNHGPCKHPPQPEDISKLKALSKLYLPVNNLTHLSEGTDCLMLPIRNFLRS